MYICIYSVYAVYIGLYMYMMIVLQCMRCIQDSSLDALHLFS
jgi:hypothetical protein